MRRIRHPLRRRSVLAWLGIMGAARVAWPRAAPSFDHEHAAWTALLRQHVVLQNGGLTSQVRYAGIAADRAALQSYLVALSAVDAAGFDGWSKPQQMAFLINAYNAFTIELVLTRYPKLASIKDLGSLLQSPWKLKVVPLLGSATTLDGIEHDTLRARGRYDDWRIHFALNCASVGCPMLREEAYVAARLDAQLDQQTLRFLSDRGRNRWDARNGRLEVSKIFDWYAEDFRLGHLGVDSLAALLARYADQLADAPADRAAIRERRARVAYLDYDWRLNDVPR